MMGLYNDLFSLLKNKGVNLLKNLLFVVCDMGMCVPEKLLTEGFH